MQNLCKSIFNIVGFNYQMSIHTVVKGNPYVSLGSKLISYTNNKKHCKTSKKCPAIP
jgi:hypothetical protein